jgi:hypothetical protein
LLSAGLRQWLMRRILSDWSNQLAGDRVLVGSRRAVRCRRTVLGWTPSRDAI